MPADNSAPVNSKRRPPRWLLGVLFGSALLVGGMLAVGILLVPRWIETRVIREAATRGWYLRFGKLDFSLDQLRLAEVEIRPLGDAGWALNAKHAEIDLRSFEPAEMRLSETRLSSSRALSSLLEAIQEHPPVLPEFPITLSDLDLQLTGEPTLLGRAKPVVIAKDRISLEFGTLSFGGVPLAPADVTLTKDTVDANLTLLAATSPVRVRSNMRIVRQERGTVLMGQLRPDPIRSAALPKSLARALPANVEIDGGVQFDAEFLHSPSGLARAEGSASLTLRNYTPPHPIELNGFSFGDHTAVSTRWKFAPSTRSFSLQDLFVEAGALRLRGSGTLNPKWQQDQFAASGSLTLAGQLPCAAVAASAILAHENSVFGQWAAGVAKIVASGGVDIRAQIDVDTTRRELAEVRTGIGIGCGLRPLTLGRLIALAKLPGFEDLKSLLRVPSLDELPSLTGPTSELPKPRLPWPVGAELPSLRWRTSSGTPDAQRLQETPPPPSQ